MNKTNWRWQMLAPVFAALLLLADASIALFNLPERFFEDSLLRLDATWLAAPQGVALIDIDPKSLDAMNPIAGTFPWPRSVEAELVEGLEAQGVRAIVFDQYFNEADTFQPDGDTLFRDTVARHDNIYLPTLLLRDGHGAPLNRLAMIAPGLHLLAGQPLALAPLLLPLVTRPADWRGGLGNDATDSDGVQRRQLLYMQRSGWILPTMPARVAHDLGWKLPTGDRFMLHWYRHGMPRYSFSDIYASIDQHQVSAALGSLSGKVVVIGASAAGIADPRHTPVRAQDDSSHVLAVALANLQNQQSLRTLPLRPWLGSGVLAWLIFSILRGQRLRRIAWQLGLLNVLSILAALWLVHDLNALVQGLSGFLAAWLVLLMQASLSWALRRAEHRHHLIVFNRFLDPGQAQALIARGDSDRAIRHRRRDISFLQAQLYRAPDMPDTHSADDIFELLNRYVTRQTAVVFKFGGTLDRTRGNAIAAFWNAPLDDAEHAQHAVAAALYMSRVLEDFNADYGSDAPRFSLGIGIASGSALVGLLGPTDQQDYTALGAPCDLARGIESLTHGRASILVCAATRQACADAFEFIDHGMCLVSGQREAVQVFEPRWRAHP